MKYAADVSVTVEAVDEQEAWEKIGDILSQVLDTHPDVVLVHWSVGARFADDDD